MSADTDPRCPLCGAMLRPMVEHRCKADPDSPDEAELLVPFVRAVFPDGTTLEPQPPGAGVFELRELLAELVAILHRPNKFCEGCGRWQGSWHDANTGNQGILDNHAPGCPVDRARRAVT